jgi:hypothetical protein
MGLKTWLNVHQRLGYQRHYADRLDQFLTLTDLTPAETAELMNIRSEFDQYLVDGAVLEGQVRILSVNSVLRLGGFNRSPITIRVETAISPIKLAESKITGRIDLLAIRTREDGLDFWLLVVESKESGADAMQGLSQLLTYASDKRTIDQQVTEYLLCNSLPKNPQFTPPTSSEKK